MTLKPGLPSEDDPKALLKAVYAELDAILATLKEVDPERLRRVDPKASAVVAEAKVRLRDLGAK